MSTEPISPTVSELPSPTTFHYEESDFDLNCPHSPTSSLRGVFVRSRPNSMAVSELNAAELNFPSNFTEFGMTRNITVPVIQAAPPARKKKPTADTASVRTTLTTLTTRTAPIRAVRRVVPDDSDKEDEDIENVQAVAADTRHPRRRDTWTGIRARVSGIFHRKQHKPAVAASTEAQAVMVHATPRHKASKFSLRARANTVGKAAVAPVSYIPQTASETTPIRRQRVRRSQSFSGFTSMSAGAASILAAIADSDDLDLDEATLEASLSAQGVSCLWRYEEEDRTGEGAGDEFEAMGLLEVDALHAI